ncbi:MAG: FAD-dependent oxidoreductase [Clostridia bacterium]|jgi:glycine/D-amino acid oxidase-like deaminating enzyme/nitrite reductase/ring-hydroxylating ferredoxin subunit
MNSFWLDSIENKNKFNKLEKDISTDVCIVGAGIFGLTCGYYLTKQGYNVVLLEKEKDIASKTTGHTTAKITSQHNLIYKYLIDSLGESMAKKYLYANQDAIENIYQIINDENIDCDFVRQDSYVYTNNLDELEKIKLENKAVNSLGFKSEFVTSTPLPFNVLGALRFPNQAEFNPIKYAYGLAKCITSNGSSAIDGLVNAGSVGSVSVGDGIVENSPGGASLNLAKGTGEIYTDTLVQNIKKENDEFITSCKDYVVRSKYVILASHYPFIDRLGYYFLKMYQSTSYVIAVDIGDKTFDGMYINSKQPTFSYRFANFSGSCGKRLLLVGGADHKTGSKIDLSNAYSILEYEVRKYYPDCKVLYKWNTEDCITLDKIPYIGEFSHFMPNMYIGTGFNKWGMTSSNVAGNIIVDKILGRENEYENVFKATRLHPIKNNVELGNMIKETTNSFVINKFKVPDADLDVIEDNSVMSGSKKAGNFEEIKNDSGHVLKYNGQTIGIYKDNDGKIFAVNPICTHLGCLLSWNNLDKTWDCPCHGSRFDYKGHQLYNPAIRDLDVIDLS